MAHFFNDSVKPTQHSPAKKNNISPITECVLSPDPSKDVSATMASPAFNKNVLNARRAVTFSFSTYQRKSIVTKVAVEGWMTAAWLSGAN